MEEEGEVVGLFGALVVSRNRYCRDEERICVVVMVVVMFVIIFIVVGALVS